MTCTNQLSGMRIDFAEWTRQGSAWFGEFNILREYSFDEAMTMKLDARVASTIIQRGCKDATRMLKTLTTLRAPEFH